MNDLATSSTFEINPNLRTFVKALFETMYLNFGKKFTDQWGGIDTDKMEDHWCIQLTGYTPREFKRGLNAMDKLAWPPSLPEFKKLCRPEVDMLVAYYEAVAGLQARLKGEAGTWSHPAIFWASVPMSYDLQHQTYSQMKQRWEQALNEQLSKGEWAEIPVPVLAIENKPVSVSKEKAAEFLKNVGLQGMSSNRAGLDWAHKIVKEPKKYPSISLTFAKQALGLI